jgi:hypothetical protein
MMSALPPILTVKADIPVAASCHKRTHALQQARRRYFRGRVLLPFLTQLILDRGLTGRSTGLSPVKMPIPSTIVSIGTTASERIADGH